MKIESIGQVHAENGTFQLQIQPQYQKGLEDLQNFSHIQLLWWGHHSDTEELRHTLTCTNPYHGGPDTLGVFATRSPFRPNPLLLSIVEIQNIDVEKGVISLYWVDAEHGTPILDIKPYLPCSDRVKNSKVAEWCQNWPEWYEDSAHFDWSKVLVY
ncbi:tRNA (N6-threonylcarbamoyladenosine(37)-N6)-methyltransferase TrmO [Vibrio nigripulchritudo]|uniref:tRNA (N6-threonylcarbamoyladenosine(37)-N6)-methyltransferase TrmO n=1 Tax=Vibrio nigripulchritudo TaxID=28173 RepID=UPI0024901A9F|nr:tRNA (N6-threonylcarbamoyladenosine(37)-N6)-methyltransferase TrmO [Vibrio nigripulchritudo]BDU39712.1 tRNA (N6-threonylcarbamoyladenosine(37)-N6)-methyltransferase TrmO [Vibrio nigripulchritudo]BDU45435.1 tRNA (N6-threonylcarbamoyladenosine(37)-N6)-methyltransferase TrmO [Vibrio nigripulchritudo]